MNLTYNLEDYARLYVMRLFWKGKYRPAMLAVWLHPEHPGRERFLAQRDLIEAFLDSDDPEAFARVHAGQGHSLRTLIRDIPVLFPKQFRKERQRLGLT